MMGGMHSDQVRRGFPYPNYVQISRLLFPVTGSTVQRR